MIEFILYDVSDNQLPQGDDGKLVRYIHLDDQYEIFQNTLQYRII